MLEIKELPVCEIHPAKYNPRKDLKPGDPAYDKLAKVIETFDLVEPLVWNKRTGNLVGGHQRFKILVARGDERIPVSVVDLDETQEKALNLALNKHSGEWEFSTLADLLQELDTGGMDMEITGFSDAELERLMTWTPENQESGGHADGDAIPSQPVAPRTRRGDVWILGRHRIMCGDSREFKDVQQLTHEKKINLVVTSPPYASQRDYDESSGFRPIAPADYVDWYLPAAKNIMAILEDDGSYFLNIKPTGVGLDTELYVFDLVLAHVRQLGFHFATEFCWERSGVPKSVTRRFKNQFEPIYQFARGPWKMRPEAVRHRSENVPMAGGPGSGNTSWRIHQGGKGDASVSGSFGGAKKRRNGTSQLMSSVQGLNAAPGEYVGPGFAFPGNRLPTFSGSHSALGHAAAYPVGLPSFFIKAFTDDGDSTYDPFAGSGSTLVASEKLNRKHYAMELSPSYVDICVQRWEEFTGLKGELEK